MAIQQHFQNALEDPNLVKAKSGEKYWGLKSGLKVRLAKIDIYLEKALVGDYPSQAHVSSSFLDFHFYPTDILHLH